MKRTTRISTLSDQLFFLTFMCTSIKIIHYRKTIFTLITTLFISCFLTLYTYSQGVTLSESELQLLNTPAFKKRFIDSYIAETDIEPRVTIPEREQMERVLDLISANNMDDAIRMLNSAQSRMNNAVFDFTLANILFQQDKLEDAAEMYQIALEKYPKFRRAWRNLAIIQVRQNLFDQALHSLTRVIELGGGDAIIYGLLGFSYSSAENFLSAESAYRMALLLDPATLDWKMGLARCFFKQERYAEAASLCSQLLKENPESAELWLLQANAWIGLNQPLKAAENYQILDQLGKSTPDSLFMLGDIYINEELYPLAIDAYLRALNGNLDTGINRALRSAKILATRGAFSETQLLLNAIESKDLSSLASHDRKEILLLRARMAIADGASDDEVKLLEEIVQIDPLDGEALILLGQHYSRSNDSERAVFYYERAASIESYEAEAKIRHAQLLVNNGKYAEALPLLRRAQLINPRENIQQYLEQVERVANAR